jgi:hypothetical protein
MKRIFCLFILIATTNAYSQSPAGTAKGSLTETSGSPVPFSPLMLKKSSDSVLYKGEMSNELGEFTIEKIQPGEYFLEINATGFAKKYIAVSVQDSVTYDLGKIVLDQKSTELNTVSVVAEKPFIERQADKTVVNVENSIVQAGSSLLEVMEKLPGVLVDQDGQIAVKGKQGVVVMIDGKPSVLSGQDLANLLRGIPSSGVQKIEIITNPSAKYDAAGNAGIINIVMKRNRLAGFNGSISTGYGQGRYSKYNAAISLNYKKDWYNLFFNYSYANRKGFNNLMLNRKFYEGDTLNTVFETDNYIVFPFVTHTPRLGADFNLSKKTTLSLLGSGVANSFEPYANNHTDILNGAGSKVSSYDFRNDSDDNWYNYSGNAQLNTQLDTAGQELRFDLDYARYWNNTDQLFTTTTKNASDSVTATDYLVGAQHGNLYLYSGKLDYTLPLKKSTKFEAGIKSSYVSSDNNMEFFNRISGEDLFDSARSSHFLYSENINAAYVNFNKQFEKLTVQLGLRAEQTIAKGEQVLDGQNFSRSYEQLFPTAFIDYKLSEKHGLNLSLGRRIDRPGYEQMNPFKRLIDATTYSEGNPYLLPQLTYNTELTYSYDNTFFATAGYSITTQNITDVLIQDAASRTTVQTIVNINEFNYYSLNLSYSKRLTKWWNTNTSILSYYGIYTGTINNFNIDQGTPSFYFSTNNSFSIVDGFSMECSFNYNYKMLYGVTTMNPNSNLTIGAQKTFNKKRGTITLNCTDIFWKAYPSGVTDFGNVNESWTSKRDTRVVNLTISFKLGKGQGARMRRNTGADEEKSRISNG